MALWGQLTSSSPTPTSRSPACTPFELPSGGAIVFNVNYTSTLTAKLTFQQPCDDPTNPSSSNPGASGNSTVIGPRDPFYASTSPQIFAIATATVISYLLVIIIFITPRTFSVAGLGGASSNGFLARSANTSVVGVGRRPWLQKIATITVAISLTIATADTFRVAQDQYDMGYTDAGLLVDDVVGSLEIRIVRVISDTFLWLAQVQTLIRLFPRHKEKVTIKWLGFALVSLDTIFSILNNFVNQSTRTRPRSFQDAIPALNYLFELAISLIYASCVIYYSLSKRRFAFWHNRMRNICLIALLSLIAVLIPVVFFVLDISKPDLAGWGDYIRWVGAAAASVVVWEWVERIEALERDERKDGILGREIFDGDEMLDGPSAAEVDFPWRRQYWNRNGFPTDDPDSGATGAGGTHMRSLRSRIPFGNRLSGVNAGPSSELHPDSSGTIIGTNSSGHPTMPPQAASPVSRSDTTSAGSTIYAIRYHNIQAPAIHNTDAVTATAPPREGATRTEPASGPSSSETTTSAAEKDLIPVIAAEATATHQQSRTDGRALPVWRSVPNPFKRRRASPPAEVAAQITESVLRRSPAERTIALRDRFVTTSRMRLGRSGPRALAETATMAVTVIPAQRRGNHTWSPDELAEQDEPDISQEEQERVASNPRAQTTRPPSQPSTTSPPPHPSDEQDYNLPILVIPAPRRGQRTWSPEDAYTGPVLSSPAPGSRLQPQPPDLPDGSRSPPPMISTRGTLTISEDQTQSRSRRSTYSRTSPVYERGAGSPNSNNTRVLTRSTAPTTAAAASPSLERVLESDAQRADSNDAITGTGAMDGVNK